MMPDARLAAFLNSANTLQLFSEVKAVPPLNGVLQLNVVLNRYLSLPLHKQTGVAVADRILDKITVSESGNASGKTV